ncbi:hypothetical protein D3C81_1507580 [compost metagenome]
MVSKSPARMPTSASCAATAVRIDWLARSSRSMFTSGLASRKRLTLGMMKPLSELLLASSRILPFSPAEKRPTSPCMRSTPSSNSRTWTSSVSPAGVSSMPRAVRTNSGVPIACSRFFSR